MRIELAGGVIADADSRLLLIHRNTPGLTQWELPGGQVEPDETAAAAVARELREELGIVVAVGQELGQQDFRQYEQAYSYRWLAATIIEGRPHPREVIHDDCAYFSLQQLRRQDGLSLNMKNLLKKLIDGDIRL